jgi:tetratricopeptide (TPR) repeat protein
MIVVAEEGSDRQVLCWGMFCLGFVQKRLGQIDLAIPNLQRAIAMAEELPDYYTHICAGSWLSHCYLAQGAVEQALSINKTIDEVNRAHSIPVGTPYLGNARSEAYLAAAEGSTGKARQAWLKKARHSCRETLKAAKMNRPTLPHALMFQGRYEWLRGKPESAQRRWQKALHEARRIGDPYQEGTIHLEAGYRLNDRAHLLQAASILEAIGAEFDLAAARKTLDALEGG